MPTTTGCCSFCRSPRCRWCCSLARRGRCRGQESGISNQGSGRISRILSHSCFLFPVSCFLFPVSCFLFPVSCFLFPVSCFLTPDTNSARTFSECSPRHGTAPYPFALARGGAG